MSEFELISMLPPLNYFSMSFWRAAWCAETPCLSAFQEVAMSFCRLFPKNSYTISSKNFFSWESMVKTHQHRLNSLYINHSTYLWMHAKTHQKLNLPLSETISDRIRDYQRPHQRPSLTTSETITNNIRDHLRQPQRLSLATSETISDRCKNQASFAATYALM